MLAGVSPEQHPENPLLSEMCSGIARNRTPRYRPRSRFAMQHAVRSTRDRIFFKVPFRKPEAGVLPGVKPAHVLLREGKNSLFPAPVKEVIV